MCLTYENLNVYHKYMASPPVSPPHGVINVLTKKARGNTDRKPLLSNT